MTLSRDHNDIVFHCDGDRCHETISTWTSNFDSAQNALHRAHWKARRADPASEWEHFCPDCQGSLL